MDIAARYLRAKAQQKIKNLLQEKRNYVKGSELNQKAMIEAKAEHRAVSILAFNGHANYKAESDYITSLNKQIAKLNRL